MLVVFGIGANTPCTGAGATHCNLHWWSIYLTLYCGTYTTLVVHWCICTTLSSLAPQFHWLTTAKAIQIYFQADYFTGPTPDGHEVLVWPKTVASPSTASALSHYFPLSTLNATVEGLLPSTEYFLYVRVNGTHFANNQGSWVRREAKTRAPGMPLHDGTLL